MGSGLKVFGIGVKEGGAQAEAWSGQHGLTYPVSADPEGEILRRLGAVAVPYHFVLDRDLRVVLSTGDFEKDSLIAAIEGALERGKENGL